MSAIPTWRQGLQALNSDQICTVGESHGLGNTPCLTDEAGECEAVLEKADESPPQSRCEQ
jgi:hypothetical protein